MKNFDILGFHRYRGGEGGGGLGQFADSREGLVRKRGVVFLRGKGGDDTPMHTMHKLRNWGPFTSSSSTICVCTLFFFMIKILLPGICVGV